MCTVTKITLQLQVPHKRIWLWFVWLRLQHAFGLPIDVEREAARIASWCKTKVI